MNPNESHIDEHLLLDYLLGKCDTIQRNRIEVWLDESKANRVHLDKLESLWLEAGKLDPAPVAVDVEAAWERMEGRIREDGRWKMEDGRWKREERRGGLAMRVGGYWRIAAAILLLIGVYSIYRWIILPVPQIELVAVDGAKAETLPDGSQITLQAGSALTYPEEFSASRREVKLSGTAFFQVKRDSMVPFIVDAGSAKIMVLGTSFQVKAAKDSAVEVMVTKGRVMLFKVNPATGDTASVILTAGTKGILPLKTLVPVLVENGNADDLYWFDHTLEFRKTPLSEVFRLLEKYYSISVDCKNDQINRCMLTATFVNDPIERIMEVIGLSFDLKIDASDQTYIITGNGCTEGDR